MSDICDKCQKQGGIIFCVGSIGVENITMVKGNVVYCEEFLIKKGVE